MKRTMVLDLEIEAGELAQRLAHQPRLQTGQRIAHLAFEFGLGRQRRDRVDHDDVDAAGAHQRVGDFQRLFARVGLGDQHFVDIDAELLGIDRDRAHVRRRYRLQCRPSSGPPRRHAAPASSCPRFRTVDLDHAAARQAADAKRDVEARASRSKPCRSRGPDRGAQLHDRALAERPVDLGQRRFKRALPVPVFSVPPPAMLPVPFGLVSLFHRASGPAMNARVHVLFSFARRL